MALPPPVATIAPPLFKPPRPVRPKEADAPPFVCGSDVTPPMLVERALSELEPLQATTNPQSAGSNTV